MSKIFSPTGVCLGDTNDYVVVIPPRKDGEFTIPVYLKDVRVVKDVSLVACRLNCK